MAMMDAEALFIDTNVLVYANIVESPYHEQALAAITVAHQAGRTIWISRQVIREYLVTLTRPQVFEILPRATVLEQIGRFIDRFEVADDTTAVTEQLLQLLTDFKIGGKQVHDTNIVATMQAYGIPALLTHNVKDFKQFGAIIRIEEI